MPFPPQKTDSNAPAQQDNCSSDHTMNPAHDGGHGAHAPNGHATPAQQSAHQSALNSGQGAPAQSQQTPTDE